MHLPNVAQAIAMNAILPPPCPCPAVGSRCTILLLLSLSTLPACRSAPPGQQLGANFVPLVEFDVEAAKAMLTGGTAVIEGRAVAKERDTNWLGLNLSTGHWARPGTLVTLFPRTSYFDAYLALRDYHGAAAQISAEAFSWRREARVGDEGAFEFRDLGPGEYYLEAVVGYTQQTAEDVQTGVQYTTIRGSNPHFSWEHVDEAPIYTTFYGSYEANVLARGFVTIDPGDESVSIKIRN